VHDGVAVVGCDGVHSVVRERLIATAIAVSGHVVYPPWCRAPTCPKICRWNAAAIWVGPNCHLVHYPLRGGEQYNIVVTFHSGSGRNGACAKLARKVMSYFTEICARRATAGQADVVGSDGRPPIAILSRVGRRPRDAPGRRRASDLQYLAQGACIALEDAVTLRAAIEASGHDLTAAFRLYESKRVVRGARLHYRGARDGRLYHAKGIERLVRNSLWAERNAGALYDALEMAVWLDGGKVSRVAASLGDERAGHQLRRPAAARPHHPPHAGPLHSPAATGGRATVRGKSRPRHDTVQFGGTGRHRTGARASTRRGSPH